MVSPIIVQYRALLQYKGVTAVCSNCSFTPFAEGKLQAVGISLSYQANRLIAGLNGVSLLSQLLKRMASWIASAATYLQRCHRATQDGSASTAYMEGLDPGQHLNSIAQARQAVQVRRCYQSLHADQMCVAAEHHFSPGLKAYVCGLSSVAAQTWTVDCSYWFRG